MRSKVPVHLGNSPPLEAAGLLALFIVLLAAPGCISSRTAANRIVDAPNRHNSSTWNRGLMALWKMYQTNLAQPGAGSPFQDLSFPVGPPAAELKGIELQPRDYHLNIASKVERSKDGKSWLTIRMAPETNSLSHFTPRDRPATILLLHGYMLSKETLAPWAFLLAQAGYRVIMVDLRGHGQSTGDSVSFGKYETVDLRQVLDYLLAHQRCDDLVGVLGFSYGATLALHWAAHDPRIRTVVAIGPYNRPDATFERVAREFKIPITHRSALKAADLAAARLNIDWVDWSGEAAMRQVRVPVLLIGGGNDAISRAEDIETLRNAAAGETKTIQIAAATHVVLPLWFQELGDPVKAWFQEHLGSAAPAAETEAPP